MSRDPLDDFEVKVTRKDCLKGFHGHWNIIADDKSTRVEQCTICNKKVYYNKGQFVEGTVVGKLDENKYRKNHKLDLLQPYYSDGTPNPDFHNYYGDPVEIQEKIQKVVEDARNKAQKKDVDDTIAQMKDGKRNIIVGSHVKKIPENR